MSNDNNSKINTDFKKVLKEAKDELSQVLKELGEVENSEKSVGT